MLLGDDRPNWRPDRYESQFWGTTLTLTYSAVKLLDYQERFAELEQQRNPFAIIVRAHLGTLATRHQGQQRLQIKLSLVRELYKHGYSVEEARNIFRFIDWLLTLPPILEQPFVDAVKTYEEGTTMPFITSVERIGREEGLQIGREEGLQIGLRNGIRLALDLKFGDAGLALLPELARITDPTVLETVLDSIKPASTVDAVRAVYVDHLPPPTTDPTA